MIPCQEHLGSWGLTMQRLLPVNFTSSTDGERNSKVEVKIGWAWFCCQAIKPKSASVGLTKVLKEQVCSCMC